jgi:hypothetical protein
VSNANAVGRGTSANRIKEKPGSISTPSNSITDEGSVGGTVGVFVIVDVGTGVSVELMSVCGRVEEVSVVMVIAGLHEASKTQKINRIFLKRLSQPFKQIRFLISATINKAEGTVEIPNSENLSKFL